MEKEKQLRKQCTKLISMLYINSIVNDEWHDLDL